MKHLAAEFERLRRRYPEGFESSLVLPCLHRLQQERGYVADEDITWLAGYLDVPRIQIEEVLGHYTMLRRVPIGHTHVQLCHNVSCSLRGSEALLGQLCERLAIRPGQTTADGRVTLDTVECLGACGGAPVLMVGEAYVGNVDAARLDALMDGWTR